MSEQPYEFVSQRVMYPWMFDDPRSVDWLILDMEQRLVWRAWKAGWLPEDVTWDFWMSEGDVWQGSLLPYMQCRMVAQRRRAQ